jgi:hypothetical protein
MELSADQLKKLSAWAAEGQSLSGIQKRMEDEFNLRMTYMQLRFLLDDYSIEVANAPAQEPKKPLAPAPAESKTQEPAADIPAEPQSAQDMELAGGVTVEVDRINRPGSVLSGDVTFSDGIKAKWYLDQMGRLGLDGVDKNYRPAPEDVQDFQTELQKILQKKGY